MEMGKAYRDPCRCSNTTHEPTDDHETGRVADGTESIPEDEPDVAGCPDELTSGQLGKGGDEEGPQTEA